MKIGKAYILNLLIISMLSSYSIAQEDSVSNSFLPEIITDNVKISGGIGGMSTFYNASGVDQQRDPLFWQLNANLNIQVGQISIPFSAVVNQQQRSFTQPFNQYGLSPKYKWITAHMGYRSLKFSDYSLGGNQFLGGGIELNPEKGIVRGKVLYGRFAKAVDGYFTDGKVVGEPSFERWGWGGMVEVGTQKNNVGVLLFRAKDDLNSIVEFAEDATIKPGENMIFGLTVNQQITKKLKLDGEIDWSAYTRDVRVEESVFEGFTYLNNIPLFYANSTSSFNKAIRGELSYNEKKYKFGLAYRRVDPEYLSMGSVYLNNDFEDLQAKTSFRMLKNKLSLSGSAGFQRNNLNDDKASEMLRLISSINANYNISQSWMVNAVFSNFNSQSQMAIVNTLDTMRYAQVTKNASFQTMYAKANDKFRNGLSLGVNYQNAKINGEVNSNLYNANLGYQLGILKQGLNITASLNAAQNITETSEVATLGPVLSLNKRFLSGKLSTTAPGSYLTTFIYGVNAGFISNFKIGSSYKVNRHHAFNLNGSLITRELSQTNTREFMLNFGYNYIF